MFMAHGSCTMRNVSGRRTEEWAPKYLGIDYDHRSELDYLSCVDSFQNSTTIKRLSLKRRPKVAGNNVEKTQSDISSSLWHSAESLSTSSSDDTRLLGMSSTTRGRPPLPPLHGSSSDNKTSRIEASAASQVINELKPKPATRSLTAQKQIPIVEKTHAETHTYLDQDVTNQPPPQPRPRRRLASFGGVSSPGSLSPFTGLGAYNQNNNGNEASGTGSDKPVNLTLSLGSRGSTGCLRMSPQSSGRTTPVTGLGPMQLQHVRDQMVIALQRLKELEEQVKIIPILQVKISVLQEEKRQLVFQLKHQSDSEEIKEVIWKTACSVERSDMENKANAEEGSESTENIDWTGLREFKQLTEEMQALEKNVKAGHLQGWLGKGDGALHDKDNKSVAVGTYKDINMTLNKPTKEDKYAHTRHKVETRSVATEVSEVKLGIYIKQEAELEAQQLTIGALKEKICQLEAELKESVLQTEMSRLKLELQVAGARNRADKASLARPQTVSTGVEVWPHTTSRGVGNHTEVKDACVGQAAELKSVGVSCCGPDVTNALTGPDVPMSHWEIRERAKTLEKGVGTQVATNTQGVGTELLSSDAETNTEEPVENPWSKKGKVNYHSVACGDCSVDVIICEAKEVSSQGMATDPVRGIDLGVTASPQTASQRTNTESSSVSRFTNTRHAFSTDSCTNTLLSTQDKHTNTTQTVTRTVSVGNRLRDIRCIPETCTVGVGTSNVMGNTLKQASGTTTKATRDIGVGFTNINENFLVGLKTRNMASGPSHQPDPITTRSIGVGEGKVRDLSVSPSTTGPRIHHSTQSQWDSELNHYIEEMQRLLGEHGDLVTEDYSQQSSGRENKSSKPYCNNKATTQGATDVHHLDSQPTVSTGFESDSQLSLDSFKCDKGNPGMCQQGGGESEVKRMIQMLEQQTSSALQGRSTNAGMLRPVVRKQNNEQACGSNRRGMKFMRVTTGLGPKSSNKQSVDEEVNSEEVETGGSRNAREVSQDGVQARKRKGGSVKGSKAFAKCHAQQRFKLSERISSACRALNTHLSDNSALSSSELQGCVETLQQEWFSVSSHKSAVPDTVYDYMSAFRAISPSVLQHVANMADSNGNTALHYSVSHSNFGIVKKLLDAEVCNVNQQNKAGYTPVMLAALAAVEAPEEMKVVEQLFAKGDVNAKASQAGQTALMLAVSHGRTDTVKALLAQGARVNVQDDEGSTALMCASEHGRADIVKLLLSQPDCDAGLTDSDESTALSIAMEAGHHDIAVLLYAHANFSKAQTGAAARHSGRSQSSSSSSGARNNCE